MKFLPLLCLIASSALAGDATQTLSGRDNPRASTVTGYMDYWQVKTAPCRLVSLYGYNSGSQQWVNLFDSANGPVLNITGFSASTDTLTNSGIHSLSAGEPIQFTNTIGGAAAAIYYAVPTDTNTFKIATTRANATAASPTVVDLTGGTASATVMRVPVHTFAIASADNYSCIVQSTGLNFGRGLVVATSSTGPIYTPATSSNITATVTLGPPL